ncbi:MAG TPA: hypothetical protein VMZ22_09930 [Acidimicrobiales bacterium]|nr:hypothetical protein [Acidimicrobiales bacterium]
MRKSSVQLYAPFLVLMIVQALFVAVAPSRGPSAASELSAGQSGGSGRGSSAGGADGFTEGATDGGAAIDGGSTSGGGGGTSGGGSTGSAGSGGVGGGGAAAGSTAHCKDGQQFKLVLNNPAPCVPKFSGDNGGATYQGVTKDAIKVIRFRAQPNEQVDAILAKKGLVATAEEDAAFQAAALNFVNKHYEFYGRKLVIEEVMGACPTTPPDYDACNAAAQEVVKKKPALIYWNTSLYASVFDIWAKAGIPSIGGSSFDIGLYNQRRPYRYDVFMDGTNAADHISEYYCKKMAKKNADHSGQVIHSRVGARGQVLRKLGIVVPEIEANVLTAKRVAEKVKACGGGDSPIFTYESDIQRATEQTQATVSALIENKVTTVTCMCDPIAPAFLTKGMTGNSYFPEFMLPGLGLLDYDLLGQLYDTEQMAHAFGPSHLGQTTNLDATDAALVWRAEGNKGHPCGNAGCGLNWAYVNAVAIAVQVAGPNFNPLNLEKGMLTSRPTGGWEPKHNPSETLFNYGPNDYTGLGDVREVYWSTTAVSPVDGSRGAYLSPDGGRRYVLGQWPSNGLGAIPVSAR